MLLGKKDKDKSSSIEEIDENRSKCSRFTRITEQWPGAKKHHVSGGL